MPAGSRAYSRSGQPARAPACSGAAGRRRREVTLTRASEAIWIGYTTLYREGGPKFERAALTLAADKRREFPGLEVRCERLESKREFLNAMRRLEDDGLVLRELHLVVHSGMYGPMFGSTAWPEQFSPHEWRTMKLPLGPAAAAFFHACRSARWFAPFFARTHGVPAHGYHWYTSVSAAKDRFRWDGLVGPDAPLYIFGIPGRKSHGALGSVRKYLGLTRPSRCNDSNRRRPRATRATTASPSSMIRCSPTSACAATSGAGSTRGCPRARACSTSAAATERCCGLLAPRIASGVGVDASPRMIERARARAVGLTNLRFAAIDGPRLPLPDAERRRRDLAAVVSLPRLGPDHAGVRAGARAGRAPARRRHGRRAARRCASCRDCCATRAGSSGSASRQRRYHRHLARMVGDPRWAAMLRYNPIRAVHELRWYFQSRFPGGSARDPEPRLAQPRARLRQRPLRAGPRDPAVVPVSLAILDWGIGGIDFHARLRARHPALPLIYWSDSGATRTASSRRDALAARVAAVAARCGSRGATRLVIACNAASTVLDHPALASDAGCRSPA
jgi:SAM-dependent methyltransferase